MAPPGPPPSTSRDDGLFGRPKPSGSPRPAWPPPPPPHPTARSMDDEGAPARGPGRARRDPWSRGPLRPMAGLLQDFTNNPTKPPADRRRQAAGQHRRYKIGLPTPRLPFHDRRTGPKDMIITGGLFKKRLYSDRCVAGFPALAHTRGPGPSATCFVSHRACLREVGRAGHRRRHPRPPLRPGQPSKPPRTRVSVPSRLSELPRFSVSVPPTGLSIIALAPDLPLPSKVGKGPQRPRSRAQLPAAPLTPPAAPPLESLILIPNGLGGVPPGP